MVIKRSVNDSCFHDDQPASLRFLSYLFRGLLHTRAWFPQEVQKEVKMLKTVDRDSKRVSSVGNVY